MKRKYASPAVLTEVAVEQESPILAGSVVDSTSVKSTGQEVQNYYFSGDTFNHQWE